MVGHGDAALAQKRQLEARAGEVVQPLLRRLAEIDVQIVAERADRKGAHE
ncbi:MAG TPA: hypothetical protein VKV26_10695 [Dehalococcoidia bacterium]|nr:hypothetical protein [Dehalococcoidia bacterium]